MSARHSTGQRRTFPGQIPTNCQHCGATFRAWPTVVARGGARFCSRECFRQWKTTPIEDRFFSYVGRKQPNGCIPWAGCKRGNGYGVITSYPRGARVSAHRLSYELLVGSPIPDGMHVLHRCDNPSCINPTHFFLGTQTDNNADKQAKGRQPRGERMGCAKLTADQVREMRARYAAGSISQRELAKEYGIGKSVVAQIILRRKWQHVT